MSDKRGRRQQRERKRSGFGSEAYGNLEVSIGEQVGYRARDPEPRPPSEPRGAPRGDPRGFRGDRGDRPPPLQFETVHTVEIGDCRVTVTAAQGRHDMLYNLSVERQNRDRATRFFRMHDLDNLVAAIGAARGWIDKEKEQPKTPAPQTRPPDP